MKFVIILLSFLISACQTLPVSQKFPSASEYLMTPCAELNLIDKNKTQLSDVLKVIVSNYELYHECSNLVSAWQEWYTKNQELVK